MYNYFFDAYRKDNGSTIGMIHIRCEEDLIFQFKSLQPNQNIKQQLFNNYPQIKKQFEIVIDPIYLYSDNVEIRFTTEYDYRNYNKQYDNECRMVESLMNDIRREEKTKLITPEILIEAGFEYLENESKTCAEYEETTYGIKNYKMFRKWTEDETPIKLDIDNGWNNRFGKDGWHIHIDNQDCTTIGTADISTVLEFNMLMKVFGSKFML